MFRQTLAYIKELSRISTDPPRAEKAMFNFVLQSFKLCKRVLTRDLLYTLMKRGIGTREVENVVARLNRFATRKGRDVKTVKFIMCRKLNFMFLLSNSNVG